MNILITGACGFIGQNLIAELEGDHELRLADAVRPDKATMFGGPNGRRSAPFTSNWPFVQVDITDPTRMREVCTGMDAVIHLAADPTGHAEKGKQIMQVHVADVVRGLKQALECPTLPGFGVYTLGAADTHCPEPTMELLERFRPDLAAKVSRPLKGREPLLSIDRARSTFAYAPRFRMVD